MEKFGETNLEKTISTYLNLRGVKQSQSAERVRKSKKQLFRPFRENFDIEDFVEVVVGVEEGAIKDCTIKTPTIRRRLHNMSLNLSMEDLQGPIHEIIDLSIYLLIQPLILTFHFSWPNLISAKESFGI
jgi:hypothetical protein